MTVAFLTTAAGCAVRDADHQSGSIGRTAVRPELGNWDDPAWAQAETLSLEQVYVATMYPTQVQVRMLYGDRGLYVIFLVDDQFVTAREKPMSNRISFDSCVEYFLQLPGDDAYFAFEFSANGNGLYYYCRDINAGDLINFSMDDYRRIEVVSSLGGSGEFLIEEQTVWTLGSFVPFEVLEKYSGRTVDPDRLAGRSWRGNFFNCTVYANPHWSSWTPLPRIDFHLPGCFGELAFR